MALKVILHYLFLSFTRGFSSHSGSQPKDWVLIGCKHDIGKQMLFCDLRFALLLFHLFLFGMIEQIEAACCRTISVQRLRRG